jgi:hypothetical protein
MKIYIMSGACYSEGGDLMSYARAFKDLESAKAALAALKEDFEENTQNDEYAGISENGMVWWSYNDYQTHCEIIESEIE